MTPLQTDVPITAIRPIAEDTFSLRFASAELAAAIRPGQFVNIRVDDHYDPLLRRPYSIADAREEECEILFSVVGKGTGIMARKKPGDTLNILGPLGNSFGCDKKFDTALILGGGIGIAPFPLLIRELQRREKIVHCFQGARSARRIIREGFPAQHVATDDGSEGFRGSVVDCLAAFLERHAPDAPMIFACGPNAMLAAVQRFASLRGIPCELSLESERACGIGICQGCPIERVEGERKYALVCTEGPCFDSRDILFHQHA